jgi:cytochrome P450
MANAVEELLRYDSPVQFAKRFTVEPLRFGDQVIPTGSMVLAALGSANRDPDRWGDDADDLDLARPGAQQHLAFGSGIHHCLGAALARLEGQEALGALARRFPDLTLADGEVHWNRRMFLRGLQRLPLTVR